MRKPSLSFTLLAGLLLITAAGSVGAQTASGSDDHHPEAASPSAGAGEAPAPEGMPQGMMGMMTPEMMQMMHQMMGQGMMGQGGGMPGMMGQGGGMPGMMGQRGGMPGMMGQGMEDGPGLLYGVPGDQQDEVTPEQVRLWLEQALSRHGNPRLAIGEIVGDDDSITAEIVTVDGSLVQKLAFNRYPGLVRQVID